MPLKIVIVDANKKAPLNTAPAPVAPAQGRVLLAESTADLYAGWKHSKIITQTTTTLVSAGQGGAIVLTDIIINVDRTNSLTLVVRFGDGTNNEILFEPDVNNLQFNESFSPKGRVGGWVNADLQAVTGGANGVTSITVIYYHIPLGDTYEDWASKRNRAQGLI